MNSSIVGKRISDMREEAGISLSDLSESTGISVERLLEMERGDVKFSMLEVMNIASALDQPLKSLVSKNPIRERVLVATRTSNPLTNVTDVKSQLVRLLETDAHLRSRGVL